jgi:hypothetical protein
MLYCTKHNGRYCLIRSIDGEHVGLDVYKLTLWAKKIVSHCSFPSRISILTAIQLLGDATYETPPEALGFDHVPKKRRNAAAVSSNMAPVHVHIRNDIPLSDQGGQRRYNANNSVADLGHGISDSGDECDLITYPTISEVLQEIHAAFPLLNILQYEGVLLEHGVAYANAVLDLDLNFFIDIIHMPHGTVTTFRTHAAKLVRRAKKGKGKAVVVENTSTEN